MITIWNKKTGEARQCEPVDAREILEHSADLYTDEDPAAEDDEPETDPAKMKVAELKGFAAEKDIVLGEAKTKAEILAVIQAALEPAD